MKILIGSDGTKPEALCARAAAARPWPPGSSFCLLNVLSPYPFTAAPIIQQKLKNKVLRHLEAAAQPLRNAGWNTTIEIFSGNARRDINKFAHELGADLVMVGCNDLNDFTRLLLGSTAQVVVRHAPCSVEVVRPHGGPRFPSRQAAMRILVATDGSKFSLAALRSVANRPWPAESLARIISVPEFILFKDPSYLESHEAKDLGKASIEDAELSIAAGVGVLSGSQLKVCSDVPTFEDRPYRVILNEADTWQADLIAVGSHGWSGFDRVIMGSVSEAVALHAKCSVEVIRQSEAS